MGTMAPWTYANQPVPYDQLIDFKSIHWGHLFIFNQLVEEK
jgi:hypothetical protein